MTPEGFHPGRRDDVPTALRERRAPSQPQGAIPKRNGFYDVTGIGAVIMAIMGLAGVVPLSLAALSAVCLGFGLMMGGVSHARDTRLINGGASVRSGVWFVFETILGIAGGILGLVGLFVPATAGPATWGVVALGSSLVAAGVGTRRLGQQLGVVKVSELSEIREGFGRAATLEAVSGLCAVILGVVALFNVFPTVFTLAAVLAVGSTVIVAGGMISVRIAEVLGPS